jgi:hypothetical protein
MLGFVATPDGVRGLATLEACTRERAFADTTLIMCCLMSETGTATMFARRSLGGTGKGRQEPT